MSTYVVYASEKSEAIWEAIRKSWPQGCYFLDDRMALIAATDPLTTPASITDEIAKESNAEENGILYVVFEMSGYYGYHDAKLWQWLGKAGSV